MIKRLGLKIFWKNPMSVQVGDGSEKNLAIKIGFTMIQSAESGGNILVESVNGKTGNVWLYANDVGADPTGTAEALMAYWLPRITPERIGAEPVGVAQQLIDALTAADIGADPLGAASGIFNLLNPKVLALETNKMDKADYVQHYRGVFSSKAALDAAIPSANAGDYADIDSGINFDVIRAVWDVTDNKWVVAQANIAQNTDQVAEGAANLYFTRLRAINAVLTELAVPQNTNPVQSTDSILQAIAKLQAQHDYKTTDELTEGVLRLYFTSSRALASKLTSFVLPTVLSEVTVGDTILQALQKLQYQVSKYAPVAWVGVSTVGNYTSSSDFIKDYNNGFNSVPLEFARINGLLWIRGSITLTINSLSPDQKVNITNAKYKIKMPRPFLTKYNKVMVHRERTVATPDLFGIKSSTDVNNTTQAATAVQGLYQLNANMTTDANTEWYFPPQPIGELVDPN